MKLRRYETEDGIVEVVLEQRTLTQRTAAQGDLAKNTFDTAAEAADEFARFERIYASRGKLIASEEDVKADARPQQRLLVLLDWCEEQGIGPAVPGEPRAGPRFFGEKLWPLIDAGELELVLTKGALHATLRTISTLSRARWTSRHTVSVSSLLTDLLSLPVAARLGGLQLLPSAAYNDGVQLVAGDVGEAVRALAQSSAREHLTELHLGSAESPNPELGDLSKLLSPLMKLERLHVYSTRGVRVGELPQLRELLIHSLRAPQQTRSLFENTWPSLTALELSVEGKGHAPALAAALRGGQLPRLEQLTVRGLGASARELRAELGGTEVLSRLKSFRLPGSGGPVTPTPRKGG